MATPEEVRAFQQNCSSISSAAEVGRGLDAVYQKSTQKFELDFTWKLSGSLSETAFIDNVKKGLKRELAVKVMEDGYIPVGLPTVEQREISPGLATYIVSVRARPAS